MTKPDQGHQEGDFKMTVTMVDKERLKTWRVIETKTRDHDQEIARVRKIQNQTNSKARRSQSLSEEQIQEKRAEKMEQRRTETE